MTDDELGGLILRSRGEARRAGKYIVAGMVLGLANVSASLFGILAREQWVTFGGLVLMLGMLLCLSYSMAAVRRHTLLSHLVTSEYLRRADEIIAQLPTPKRPHLVDVDGTNGDGSG